MLWVLQDVVRSLKLVIGPALSLTGSLTRIIPAASSSGSSPPAALEFGQSPLRDVVIAQSVGGQVTDLQPGVMSQEVRERHPARKSRGFHFPKRI